MVLPVGGKYKPLGLTSSAYTTGGALPQRPDEHFPLDPFASDPFFDEVASVRDAIKEFETSIQTLSSRHVYSLSNPSPALSSQIDALTATLRTTLTALTARIRDLGTRVGTDDAKRGHWETLKGGLQRAVARWQTAESAQRQRVKDRFERQYRILNPQATAEEIAAVRDASSSASDALFAQAVAGSRTEGASAALSESQARQAEIQQIERTITELAQLFSDVAALVMVQDEAFISVEEKARVVEGDLEGGAAQLGLAKVSAIGARNKRKICFGVALIILIVVVVVVLVEVKPWAHHSSSSPSSSDKGGTTVTLTDGPAPTLRA